MGGGGEVSCAFAPKQRKLTTPNSPQEVLKTPHTHTEQAPRDTRAYCPHHPTTP